MCVCVCVCVYPKLYTLIHDLLGAQTNIYLCGRKKNEYTIKKKFRETILKIDKNSRRDETHNYERKEIGKNIIIIIYLTK